MPKDHRYVDELSIEELEQVLRLRKMQARLDRAKRVRHENGVGGKHYTAEDPLRTEPQLVQVNDDLEPLTNGEEGESIHRYSAVVTAKPRRSRLRTKRDRRPIKWRWVWNQLLLLVEIAALLGFIYTAGRMLLEATALNQESRDAMVLPTPTPTPIISAAVVGQGGVVMLPGGHTPPDADKQSEPVPIPEHLKALVAEVTPLPIPTPGPEQARRMTIPSISVDGPVVEGDDWESLKKGIGHHVGSVNPGERGNAVYSAHNDIYGELFRDLPDMEVGDEIIVETTTQTFRYYVQQTRIVTPNEVSVLDQTSTPVLTLISCYPYGVDTHRIIVIATLAE